MKVSNLDHLGIVAGIIDEMGIVEEINTIIGGVSREKVSAFAPCSCFLIVFSFH
jgi:hypothetical protein